VAQHNVTGSDCRGR